MANEIIKTMTNLADSGQDEFVEDWAGLAYTMLYEQGISKKYLDSDDGQRTLAKVVTDLIEDGNLSATTEKMTAYLRLNHPHSEDAADV